MGGYPITWFPILTDKDANAGAVSTYLFQDLWAAQKVNKLDPLKPHYDIGSRIDGFIAYLLSFRGNINLIDVRPLPYCVDDSRLSFVQSDATLLNELADESIYSISALCSIEHFGLGRYGDPIDPTACFKAFDSIQRVVESGGHIYISVPIGRQQIAFNAHRVFDPFTVVSCFEQCKLIEFSAITLEDPKTPIIENADLNNYRDGQYTVGLFEFQKA